MLLLGFVRFAPQTLGAARVPGWIDMPAAVGMIGAYRPGWAWRKSQKRITGRASYGVRPREAWLLVLEWSPGGCCMPVYVGEEPRWTVEVWGGT